MLAVDGSDSASVDKVVRSAFFYITIFTVPYPGNNCAHFRRMKILCEMPFLITLLASYLLRCNQFTGEGTCIGERNDFREVVYAGEGTSLYRSYCSTR